MISYQESFLESEAPEPHDHRTVNKRFRLEHRRVLRPYRNCRSSCLGIGPALKLCPKRGEVQDQSRFGWTLPADTNLRTGGSAGHAHLPVGEQGQDLPNFSGRPLPQLGLAWGLGRHQWVTPHRNIISLVINAQHRFTQKDAPV